MNSFWEKLGEIYICNHCDYYSKEPREECSRCRCKMTSIQEKIKIEENCKKDLTNRNFYGIIGA